MGSSQSLDNRAEEDVRSFLLCACALLTFLSPSQIDVLPVDSRPAKAARLPCVHSVSVVPFQFAYRDVSARPIAAHRVALPQKTGVSMSALSRLTLA
jgi:hypothetical protein